MIQTKATNIDEYISGFDKPVQKKLREIRKTVRALAPEAIETIKYAMPTFVFHGNLVYFAAFKNHIGFYPAPTNHPAFDKDLAGYKTGKGSLQFPLDQPIPLTLVRKIVKWRIRENIEREALKRK